MSGISFNRGELKMRKIWLAATLVLGSLQAEFYPPIFEFQVGLGYRHDNYSMHMEAFAPNFTTDFASSTLERWKFRWNEVEILESSAHLRYTTCLNYYFRFDADFGRIHNGEGHFDGFAFNGSTSDSSSSSSPDSDDFTHFSRIKHKTNRGQVMDFSGAFGYQFRSNGRRFYVVPLVGFAWRYQRLEAHHGNQTLNLGDPLPVVGSIPDLHFMYKPRWYGGFIGVDWEVQVDVPCVLFYGTAEWHWTQFRSSNTWNFSDVFVNQFNQNGHGHGVILNGGISYKLQCNCWISAFGTFRNFHVDKGKHKTVRLKNKLLFPNQTFGTFPGFDPTKDMDLRSFKWNSWVVGLAFDYRF